VQDKAIDCDRVVISFPSRESVFQRDPRITGRSDTLFLIGPRRLKAPTLLLPSPASRQSSTDLVLSSVCSASTYLSATSLTTLSAYKHRQFGIPSILTQRNRISFISRGTTTRKRLTGRGTIKLLMSALFGAFGVFSVRSRPGVGQSVATSGSPLDRLLGLIQFRSFFFCFLFVVVLFILGESFLDDNRQILLV
jgi:hypothetical protein